MTTVPAATAIVSYRSSAPDHSRRSSCASTRASRTRSVTTHLYQGSPPIHDRSEPSQSFHSSATRSLWNTYRKSPQWPVITSISKPGNGSPFL